LGIDALTHDDAGHLHAPESAADWSEWIGATGTRAYSIGDSVIDWLARYGVDRGYPSDKELRSSQLVSRHIVTYNHPQ